MIIPGFSRYTFEAGVVTDTESNLVKNPFKRAKNALAYKLKDDNGNWKQLSSTKVAAMCAYMVEKPTGAVAIPNMRNCWINKQGIVYSISKAKPNGYIHNSNSLSSKGYPVVCLLGETHTIHSLLCRTFIQADYVEKGLVCLHRDDNKLNYSLDNLSVGTYSQNNKDAYLTGANPSKK